MKLENLQIALAQRTPWQAMDLGLQVARQHYKSLFIISVLLTCTVALLLITLCQNAAIACVLLLWFKPIVERPLLFYISRAIFADAPSIKQSLLSLTGPANRLWFKTLFIHRFSLSRSFNDPVVLLEGLQGEARSNRLRVLHDASTGSAWLSILALQIESTLLAALLVLPLILLPEGMIEFNFSQLMDGDNSFISILVFICYALSVAIVAPFYVCCGFSLYLNQRTHLEAWDIELGFRKISGRLENINVIASLPALGVFILAGLLSFTPASSWAQDAEEIETSCEAEDHYADRASSEAYFPLNTSSDAKKVRIALNTILDSDIFGQHYKEKDYSLDWDFSWDFEPEENTQDKKPWLSMVKDLALYFKYLMILLLGLLLLYVLVKYQPWLYFSDFKRHKQDKPQSILGMDMSQKSLPDDFMNIIEGHIKQQQFRPALSLMFRAHLINAIHIKQVPFKQSNTEQECLMIMQAHSSQDESLCFADLVMHWQMLAYAHQSTNTTVIMSLFNNWKTFVAEGQEK